ncbi:MAG TPA: phosphoglucosamine mutase [Candidatus Acidoferrales bacterium]|nr:phosphoglucosamine mutase [Candidatus Acidoferrales bacterium]
MPKKLFGTDGIRGVPGEYPLDDRTLFWIGRTLGDYLGRTGASPRVLMGMDTRESGPRIAGWIAQGLVTAGASPANAGVISTPGVAWLVRQKGYSGGVVISASHNPFHDNGVKLFSSSGIKFPDEVEEWLEGEIIRQRDRGPARGSVAVPVDDSFTEEYLAFLRNRKIPGAEFSSLKIVLDCANGAASRLGPQLFRGLGAQVVAIHNEPDGRNINFRCGSLHPESLQQEVLETRGSFGVAFDGDADRAVFVSASGKLVNGDGTLLAAARYLKATGQLKGTHVVGTAMANLGLERVLAAEALSLIRVPVGDRYVLEEMLRSGANLGGEQAGHIIFLDDSPAGDGLLTAVKMASLVSLEGPLDELVKGLKIFPQTILNVKVRSKPPLDSLPQVSTTLAEAERRLGDAGRIVLRYSGTEPLARVMVEAERPEDVERWAQALAGAIRSSIGVREGA